LRKWDSQLKYYKKTNQYTFNISYSFKFLKERIKLDEETLAKDEFIGLHVKIVDCSDPSWKGQSGLIVDETKNTFLIEIEDKQKMIVKKTAIFKFDIDGKKITIDGSKIMYRPEDRIKKVR
jgi:ribonuclease P protein subunit POP4